jgi:hypothetical protein
MPFRRHSADLRGRREDLSIGARDMAAGLGIGLGRLLSMEDGTALEEDKLFYRTWLSRIEGWSAGASYIEMGACEKASSASDNRKQAELLQLPCALGAFLDSMARRRSTDEPASRWALAVFRLLFRQDLQEESTLCFGPRKSKLLVVVGFERSFLEKSLHASPPSERMPIAKAFCLFF